MPTTPNYGLPFPVLDDIGDTPFDLQALAEAVDTSLGDVAEVAGMQQTGAVSGGPSNAVTWQTVVTFPVAFSAPPRVVANLASTVGSSATWVPRTLSVTSTGFTLFARSVTGTSSTFSASWSWIAAGPTP